MSDVVLRVQGLAKRYGSVRAVDGIDLALRRGEILGFLGPNGAGKTTSIGMILGLIRPTAGRVEVFGEEVGPDRTRALRRVGAVVGKPPGHFPFLTAREHLRLVARLRGGADAERIEEVLSIVGLTQAADRPAKQYSSGMRQRLGLATALLGRPEIVVLDEPMDGLDPPGIRFLRRLLKDLAGGGTALLVSSHLLAEVEQVADLLAIIDRGRIRAQGTVEKLSGKDRLDRGDLEELFFDAIDTGEGETL